MPTRLPYPGPLKAGGSYKVNGINKKLVCAEPVHAAGHHRKTEQMAINIRIVKIFLN